MVVLDRKEERPTVNGTLCCLYHDQPRWFLCSWSEQSVELEEVAFWKGIAAGNMSANHHGGITSWTMWMTAYERKPELSAVSRLAFGFASGSRPPEIHSTDVPCQGVAHVIESQDSILALVNSGYEEIKLWRLTADGRVTEVSVISPRGQRKGEVSEPAILSLADGYVFLWRYFNKKIKRLQRDGGLWFRSCDRTLSRFDEPQRLNDDCEIPTGKWIANDLGGSGLVVWANGLSQSQQQIRFVTIRLRSDLPKPSQVFPGVLPKHLLATRRGVLALSTVCSEKPYSWSLRSQSYGDLG